MEESNYKKLGNGMPESIISTIFFLIGGLLIAAGILCGIIFGLEGSSYRMEFSLPIFITYLFSGVFSGLIFIGLGEITKQLLHLNIRLQRKGYTLVDIKENEVG